MAEGISEAEATDLIASILNDDGDLATNDPNNNDTQSEEKSDKHLELVEDAEPEEGDATEGESGEEDPGEAEGESAEESLLAASGEDDEIRSIADLATAFEVGEDDLLEAIELEDREGNSTSLKHVVDLWLANFDDKVEIQAESEASMKTFRDELTATSDAELKKLAGTTQAMINHFQAEFADINWERLREDDPHAWADKRDSRERVSRLIQDSISALDTVSTARGEDYQKQLAVERVQERKLKLKAMPQWVDEKKHDAAMEQASKYLSEVHGYSADEINSFEDHRVAITAWEASEYRRIVSASRKKLKETKGRGLKRPRALKGQARRDPDDPRLKRRNEAVATLKKTGDARAAASLIEEHL